MPLLYRGAPGARRPLQKFVAECLERWLAMQKKNRRPSTWPDTFPARRSAPQAPQVVDGDNSHVVTWGHSAFHSQSDSAQPKVPGSVTKPGGFGRDGLTLCSLCSRMLWSADNGPGFRWFWRWRSRPRKTARNSLNCAYRYSSFAARHNRCAACGSEPPRPPVPIASNTEKRGADHNAN